MDLYIKKRKVHIDIKYVYTCLYVVSMKYCVCKIKENYLKANNTFFNINAIKRMLLFIATADEHLSSSIA